tara:strand:- start:105 stop:1064 length:960 start_codon:yes stop_codon:yes gene_type:complete
MNPSDFTKTSFCDTEIDNITTNSSKEYILNQLNILCNGIKYNSRYAKVFNDKFSKNLNNPHIYCLKSCGNPYLLFLSQINEINYCFLIDKKIKEGYDYPKIFILPYSFNNEYYKGSLFECELIRKNNNKWSIGINDIYYSSGKNMKKTIIIDRINHIHKLLEENSQNPSFYTSFLDICPLFIKKYFDYKDINYVINTFINLLDYEIRGIYLVPLKIEYSNILYLFENNIKLNKTLKSTKCLRIIKTLKPDVYELYSLDKSKNIIKIGIAAIQSIEKSHKILSYFDNKSFNDEILVECKYNDNFNKWEPISLSNNPIDII